MNWDWDKLQEKRQQQQKNGWGSAGRGNWGKGDDDRDDSQKNDNRNRQGGGSPKGGRPSFSWPKAPQIDGLPKMRWWILGALVVWMLSGIYIVQPDESGVVLRFGKYVRTENPGPHIHLPYPIETVYKPKVSQVRQTAVGYRAQSVGGVFQQGRVQAVNEESAMLTGDENIINVQFNIQYQIKPDGGVDYLFNVIQPDQVVKRAAEASMREVIGKTTLDSALTDGRVQIQNDVADLLQRILDRYQVGVQVVAVQMQDVQPPRDVSDSLQHVASAMCFPCYRSTAGKAATRQREVRRKESREALLFCDCSHDCGAGPAAEPVHRESDAAGAGHSARSSSGQGLWARSARQASLRAEGGVLRGPHSGL